MKDKQEQVTGWPGIPAKWTTSAKSGVGAALNAASRVWFTLSHGIFNEIYFTRVDQACTRDLGLIVADGREFFSEESGTRISFTIYWPASRNWEGSDFAVRIMEQ
jgi:glucoamylase